MNRPVLAALALTALLLASPAQAAETYRGIGYNEHLVPPPQDEAAVKGKMVVWSGAVEKHDGKYTVMRWDSRTHGRVFWAFTDPRGLGLPPAAKRVQVMGRYRGSAMVSTTYGLRRVGVVEAVEIRESTWTGR